MYKFRILKLTLATMVLSACMQTQPNPIPLSQTGDENKSCAILLSEMQETTKLKDEAHSARNRQIGINVVLGIAGAVILVPWFFIDTSNAHTVDMNAAENRFNRLNALGTDKKCYNVKEYYNQYQAVMATK